MRIFVSVLFSGFLLILASPAEAGFTRSSLLGPYGCLGNSIVLEDSSGTLDGFSELMQLNLSANGNITGSIKLNTKGERCTIAVSTRSTFSVNPDGTGSMQLVFAVNGMDTDSDLNCGSLNGLTERFDILILGSGGKFDVQSSDDTFTVPHGTGDNGDLLDPFTGTCEKQTPR